MSEETSLVSSCGTGEYEARAAAAAAALFTECRREMVSGEPIHKESERDKEFSVQDWIEARLRACGVELDTGTRHGFPDFALRNEPVGFEVKSLDVKGPSGKGKGRYTDFDCNSHLPMGVFCGIAIFFVFVRYEKVDAMTLDVHDLVICHGDLLNPPDGYKHINFNVPNFGSYGDILIRDRKMYVVLTPYSLADGLIGQQTLIVPSDWLVEELTPVGNLRRVEVGKRPVGYLVDLVDPKLRIREAPTERGGLVHEFTAYSVKEDQHPEVLARVQRPKAERERKVAQPKFQTINPSWM